MAERKEYTVAPLNVIETTPEAITSGSLDEEIRERMLKVIDSEAPILESILFKRVINSLSLKKVGARILPVFDRIASSLAVRISDNGGERVFHKDGDDCYFRPTPDSEVRYSYQIPTEEAVQCIQYILEKEGRIITKTELSRLFKKEMGYDRMGSQVDALFLKAAKSPAIKRTGNGRFTI